MIPANIDFSGLNSPDSYVHLNDAALDQLLTGAKITGACTVDYPATDGYILFIEHPDGRQATVLFDVDVCDEFECDENNDYIQMSYASNEPRVRESNLMEALLQPGIDGEALRKQFEKQNFNE